MSPRRGSAALGAAAVGLALLVAAPAQASVRPAVTAAAFCADGVLTLHVTGEGLPAGTPVVVRVTGDSATAGPTDGLGALDAQVVLPTTGAGVRGVVVTPVGGGAVRTTVDVPLCPRLALTPAQVARRDGSVTVHLDAYGFSGGEVADPVRFTLLGVTADAPQDFAGHAEAPLTLARLPECGSYPAVAVEVPRPPVDLQSSPRLVAVAAPPLRATAPFAVTCPTLSADPGTVDETDLPEPVTLGGTGWDPDTDLAVTLDGVPVPGVRTDGRGEFRVPATLGSRPCGTVTVTAVEPPPPILLILALVLDPNVPPKPPARPAAATTITVTCPVPVTPEGSVTPTPDVPPTPTPTPSSTPPTPTPTPTATPTGPGRPRQLHPTLVADPLVPSGSVATATGTGFAPGVLVTLTWLLPDGTTAPGASSVTAGTDGRFTTPCLVLPHARVGPRTLQATQATRTGAVVATADVLVVTGPMEPGRNRLLGRR